LKTETAYEVHSCLMDALETGTGKTARTEFGLKKFPAAGKTGTAYDFTDALFTGYDSNFTCAVWAGFDKPQKIYRGAFGRELALPVWVDIMNTAAARYSPREIKRPPGLNEVEICLRSGMLATDKCYDTVRSATGDPVQKRTTYSDMATEEQVAEKETPQKSDNRERDAMRGEARNQKTDKARSVDDAKPILRAIPVEPEPEETPVEIRRAVPVGPMDEVEEGALLKAATPSPSKSDDQ